MKIRTKLQLIIFLSIFLLVGIFFSIVLWQKRADRQIQQQAMVMELQHAMFERAGFREEYFLYREDRPKEQWLQSHRRIGELLQEMSTLFTRPEEKACLEKIANFHTRTGNLFNRLIQLDERVSSQYGQVGVLQRRMIGQILVESHSQYSEALKLLKLASEESFHRQRLSHLYSGIGLGIAILVVVLFAAIIWRDIRYPISVLEKGVRIVAEGNLDHQTNIRTGDEFGQLSRGFDKMTARLKEITVSRNDLIIEIENRKRVEAALRESEERYRDLVENSPDPIYILDLEGQFLSVNAATAAAFGYDQETLLKMNIQDLLAPEVRHEFPSYIRTIQREGAANGRMLIKRPEGDKRILEYHSTLRSEGTAAPVIRVISRDITEARQVEEALRESEERYRTLVETSPDAITLFDLNLNIIMVNQPALALYGYERQEEIIGKSMMEYLDEGDRDRAKKEIEKLLQTGRIGTVEFTLTRKDGTAFPAELRGSLICDKHKRPEAILCVSRDISERKQRERELASLEEQLRQAQKMEAIGRLAAGVAHDFNNALTVISGNCQLSLLDLRKEDPLRKNIEEIGEAAARAANLTRQLLAFSRKQMMKMEVLDLNDIVRGLHKMLHRLLGEDIDLVTILPEGIGKVKVDPGQIEQVIINLAVNARDAMPEGGTLAIETANVELDEAYARRHIAVEPGSYVMLSVSDTGVGMSPEVKERIFEPFFTTKERGKGTGLGLSTVYGIVKQSGGNIWVYTEPGHGTTFKIYLPRVEGTASGKVLQEEGVGEIPRGMETILVVEDEELVRKLAIRLLKSQGYKVLEASDGAKALALCEEYRESIDLLLTDVVMPGMSGRKLADRLKQIHPETKVLYMSGYTDNAIVHHGILEEGIDFIQKPFGFDRLAKKVREVIDKEPQKPQGL